MKQGGIMSKIIIGIHGLGNKPRHEILERWWRLSMEKGLAEIGNPLKLDNFKLVYWADILNETPIEPAEEEAFYQSFLNKEIPQAEETVPVRQAALDMLKKTFSKIILNDDLSINFSFITDAFVRRYFKELEVYYQKEVIGDQTTQYTISARDVIRQRLIDMLRLHEEDEVFLIAHSMGSLIAFDVLSFLVPDVKIHTFVTMGSPLGLPVIIHKIVSMNHQEAQLNHGLDTPPGIYKAWFNISDPDDRIALYNKLNPTYAANTMGIMVEDIVIRNHFYGLNEKNPHKSFGYLRTPSFASILGKFLEEPIQIAPPEMHPFFLRIVRGFNRLTTVFRTHQKTS